MPGHSQRRKMVSSLTSREVACHTQDVVNIRVIFYCFFKVTKSVLKISNTDGE